VLVADIERAPETPVALGGAIRRALERQVASHSALAVVSRQEVDTTLQRMRRSPEQPVDQTVALEVSERDGAIAAVVGGRLDRAAGEFVLTIHAADAVTRQPFPGVVARGADEGQLLKAIERGSAEWTRRIGALPMASTRQLPAVTTSSLLALRMFAQAVDLLETMPMAPQAAPWRDAAEFLRKALDEDSGFVMAKIWLALALKSSEDARLSYEGGTRAPIDLYRQLAIECLQQTTNVSEPEMLFIEGVANVLLEERQKAITAFEALLFADREFFELQTRAHLYRLYAYETRVGDADEQVLRIAELVPNDFDATVLAAQALVMQDGDTRRAAPYVARARQLRSPAITDRENSCWHAAWLEHLPAYEAWRSGDLAAAVAFQSAIAATLSARVSYDRDAMATGNGHMWLALGRVADARKAFNAIGHHDQKEWSLAVVADVLDDRRLQVAHLSRHGWSWNPLPFARAGMFERMRAVLKEPPVGAGDALLRTVSLGEEALASGRPADAIVQFQQALDRLHVRPGRPYFETSISLARAWHAVGDDMQALRVLEEAVRAEAPPTAAAVWIKAQIHLVHAYRRAGRVDEAEAIAERVRRLLAQADADHPFLRMLAAPTDSLDRPAS